MSVFLNNELHIYVKAIEELQLLLLHAEQHYAAKRYTRKLRRELALLRAYTAIAFPAMEILKPYHVNPILTINSFWRSLDYCTIIINNQFPTLQNFFEWYCEATITIPEEQAGGIT